MNIQLVLLNESKEQISKFTTTVRCDQLAFLLLDFKGNCFVKYLTVLNEEEIAILKATYAEDSMSVLDNLEQFKPNIVEISIILPILQKVRNKIIYPGSKDEEIKTNEHELAKIMRDLIAISECIAVLEYSKNQAHSVYIAIDDY